MGIGDDLSQILHRADLTPQFQGVRNTPTPLEGPHVLSNEFEDLLWKYAIVPTPLDEVRSEYYSTYFMVPKKDGSHRPILNLKFFNLNVCKPS